MESMVRVWYLGRDGLAPSTTKFGRPGPQVVSLIPGNATAVAAVGHQGIMGHRMRLRFPLNRRVFAVARHGDTRARFCKLWHRALAAGAATSIHLDGGPFLHRRPECGFPFSLLGGYVQDMVKMGAAGQLLKSCATVTTWR